MLPVCRTKVCASASTVSYDAVLSLNASSATPIDPVPYSTTAVKTAAATFTFTGFIQNATTASANVTVAIQYANVAVPAIVVAQVVPSIVTVPAGGTAPLATSVTASLPCGDYSVNVTFLSTSAGAFSVGGNLAVSFLYS